MNARADSAAIREVNAAFYVAHENRDLEAMSAVWHHGSDVVCIHPGWPILRGWHQVKESWRRILAGPGRNQFISTNEQVNIAGSVAWVTLDENLVAAGGGTGTIAATNIYLRINENWKMVHHHGSPVATRPVPSEGSASE